MISSPASTGASSSNHIHPPGDGTVQTMTPVESEALPVRRASPSKLPPGRLVDATRSYLADKCGRLQREAIQVKQEFVTAEQIHALRQSVAAKLDEADFDTKRMVLETLDTRVCVGTDGALTVWFSIPSPAVDADLDTSIVSVGLGAPNTNDHSSTTLLRPECRDPTPHRSRPT